MKLINGGFQEINYSGGCNLVKIFFFFFFLQINMLFFFLEYPSLKHILLLLYHLSQRIFAGSLNPTSP